MAVEERAALLLQTAELIRKRKFEFCAWLTYEVGKNWVEADADVAEAIDFFGFYAAVMRDLGRPQSTQRVAGETNVQQWWPRGSGIIIAPWNFPPSRRNHG